MHNLQSRISAPFCETVAFEMHINDRHLGDQDLSSKKPFFGAVLCEVKGHQIVPYIGVSPSEPLRYQIASGDWTRENQNSASIVRHIPPEVTSPCGALIENRPRDSSSSAVWT
jgi:hypothetical protein